MCIILRLNSLICALVMVDVIAVHNVLCYAFDLRADCIISFIGHEYSSANIVLKEACWLTSDCEGPLKENLDNVQKPLQFSIRPRQNEICLATV